MQTVNCIIIPSIKVNDINDCLGVHRIYINSKVWIVFLFLGWWRKADVWYSQIAADAVYHTQFLHIISSKTEIPVSTSPHTETEIIIAITISKEVIEKNTNSFIYLFILEKREMENDWKPFEIVAISFPPPLLCISLSKNLLIDTFLSQRKTITVYGCDICIIVISSASIQDTYFIIQGINGFFVWGIENIT